MNLGLLTAATLLLTGCGDKKAPSQKEVKPDDPSHNPLPAGKAEVTRPKAQDASALAALVDGKGILETA